MPAELLPILLLVSFVALLLVGIPVAYAAAASGVVFGLIGFGPGLFNLLRRASTAWPPTTRCWRCRCSGVMLEKSRLANDMLEMIGHVAAVCAAAWRSGSSCSA